ncbi:MAG TPA: glutamine-hydrolyzing carbamoyl-phosphate synthase small subunit [Burkholderiales bacterium]|nr:glutamine-hydrolyzing carbamoyl-phosphate synthase small subunit [Burkholderiales bacterium]
MLAKLVLQDGTSFQGHLHGRARPVAGEVVFNTGMVGYTEALTDPSYRGQILVSTFPLVGNYGVPPAFESDRIQASGLVVSELAYEHSHWSSQKSLPQWLDEQGIPCLSGIDTRALTKRLREKGAQLGKIVTEEDIPFEDPNQRDLVGEVSVSGRMVYENPGKTVVVVDCGAKEGIVRHLLKRGLRVVRVPASSDFAAEDYDGLFVTNGPGDPAVNLAAIASLRRAMERGKPIMGICLGNQLLALAAGANTYKLKFGHRGHNQPCIEVGTQRCYITSQNHGFAVDGNTLPAGWHEWFRNANDGSNEGIRHATKPFLSVQFHPEAAPGPTDCEPLFDRFVEMLK